MNSGFKLKGTVIIETRKKDGIVIEREELDNLLVDSGLERVVKLLSGVSAVDFTHIAIGTGTTAAANDDTALETEIVRAEADDGGSYEADYKAVWEKTFSFGSGESYSITEAGVSDSATVSGSVLLDRFVFAAKEVDADVDLYIKITVTASRS